MEQSHNYLYNLPNEILILIMSDFDYLTLLYFTTTCKKFRNILNNTTNLSNKMFSDIFPKFYRNDELNIFDDIRLLQTLLRQKIQNIIVNMTEQYTIVVIPFNILWRYKTSRHQILKYIENNNIENNRNKIYCVEKIISSFNNLNTISYFALRSADYSCEFKKSTIDEIISFYDDTKKIIKILLFIEPIENSHLYHKKIITDIDQINIVIDFDQKKHYDSCCIRILHRTILNISYMHLEKSETLKKIISEIHEFYKKYKFIQSEN